MPAYKYVNEDRAMRGIILIALLAVHGCATVVNGTNQSVRFDTRPSGGTIAIYDSALYRVVPIYRGPLPASVMLTRDKIYKYDVERDGYQALTAMLKPSMSGWEVASDLIPVLALIDLGRGAGRKFDAEIIIPLQVASPAASDR
jgi:hypothetical protein